MGELFARSSILPVPSPIDLLQLGEELQPALTIPCYGARLHVRDSFPGLGMFCEVFFVCTLGLYKRTLSPVRAKPRVDREDYAIACIRADHLNQTLGYAGPEERLRSVGVGDHKREIRIGSEVKFPCPKPAQRDDHHLPEGSIRV